MPRVSPSGTVSQQLGSSSAVQVNPFNQTVGAGTQVGDVGVSAGIGPTGPRAGVGANVYDSGDVNVNLNAGVSGAGFNVTPTVQIGEGTGATTGAQVGGMAGTAAGTAIGGPVGGAIGGALGSAAGSVAGGIFGGNSKVQQEHKARSAFKKGLNGIGFFDSGTTGFTLPDGTMANFMLDSDQGMHDWYNPAEKGADINRPLFAYETDYTAPLDYLAAMGGITLSRLLAGDKNKSVDQIGNLMGNQALGKAGYGAELNNENFGGVMTNLRSMFARGGIQNKQDFLSLAGKAFGDNRISDTDFAVMQQTANLVFDGDFNLAQSLVGNKQKGIDVAKTTPAGRVGESAPQQKGVVSPHGKYAPIISPEEAMLSVKPYFDYLRANKPSFKESKTQGIVRDIQGGANLVSAIGNLYKESNKLTGGAVKKGITAVTDALGLSSPEKRFELDDTFSFDPDTADVVGGVEPVMESGNLTFDTDLDFTGV